MTNLKVVPTAPADPLRVTLKDAMAARVVAETAVETARATLARSTAAIEDAEQHSKQFDGLAGKVARHHAAQLRAGKSAKGDLPDDIRAEQLAARDAIDARAGLQASHAILADELTAAEWNLKLARHGIRNAAAKLLAAEAAKISEALAKAKTDAYALEHALKACLGIQVPDVDGRPKTILVEPGVVAPLHLVVHEHPSDPSRAAGRFHTWFNDLQSDPDAELGAPETLFGLGPAFSMMGVKA